MPRKPGSRIESPDTLGRKCWAFAWLKDRKGVMEAAHARLASVGLNVSFLKQQWEVADPEAMTLCRRVMANWCVPGRRHATVRPPQLLIVLRPLACPALAALSTLLSTPAETAPARVRLTAFTSSGLSVKMSSASLQLRTRSEQSRAQPCVHPITNHALFMIWDMRTVYWFKLRSQIPGLPWQNQPPYQSSQSWFRLKPTYIPVISVV